MPPLLLQEMEQNLAMIPFIFANEDDFVLTEKKPSTEFTLFLSQNGLKLPHFKTLSELENYPKGSINAIIPWGWSPAAYFKFKKLKEKCSDKVSSWGEHHQLLFERKTSLELLKNVLLTEQFDWLPDATKIGQIVTNTEEIDSLLKVHQRLVLKAPLSSSGRGLQFIRKTKLNTANKQWVSGVLKQQKYLIAEPLLEKVADLSFHFEIQSETNINEKGYTFFETNSNGQYKATYIHPNLNELISEELDMDELKMKLELISTVLKESLSRSIYSKLYKGFLGVDALLLREEGKLKIQPCIEVNCRMNMGILTKLLEDRVHQDARGKFEMFYGSSGQFGIYAREQISKNPFKSSNGKLLSGFVPLVEPDSDKKFGAYIALASAR